MTVLNNNNNNYSSNNNNNNNNSNNSNNYNRNNNTLLLRHVDSHMQSSGDDPVMVLAVHWDLNSRGWINTC